MPFKQLSQGMMIPLPSIEQEFEFAPSLHKVSDKNQVKRMFILSLQVKTTI